MRTCNRCGKELTKQQKADKGKYCSRSCAAIVNNTGVRRHGKPAGVCVRCGKPKADAGRKYCSTKCMGEAQSKNYTIEERRAHNAAHQALYRARHGCNRAPAANANRERIKQIYANCPEGYEVDHIIPLSRGGSHHEDNLQYLTIKENRRKGNKILDIK